jgi:ubiquinone/menaquinone biosynthesis C-methylase UbiE
VGVDASAGMLAIARARIADPRVSWIEGDVVSGAHDVVGRGQTFELVLFCLVLEHMEDLEPAIAAAGSVLAPSGRLLIIGASSSAAPTRDRR